MTERCLEEWKNPSLALLTYIYQRADAHKLWLPSTNPGGLISLSWFCSEDYLELLMEQSSFNHFFLDNSPPLGSLTLKVSHLDGEEN